MGVSAAENLRFPIMSDVMASQQTIFVDREDKSSAARAAALIAAVAADNRFPPLVVYPEGARAAPRAQAGGTPRPGPGADAPIRTRPAHARAAGNTSNGRQLCAFRAGPFAPLVAVQPVVISYARGGPVDPSWVEPLGPPVHLLALRMLLTPSLRMTAQYLAPMGPLAGEAPAAFGRRVQAAMASALGVPVVEYSFSDTRLMFAARKLGLDPAACCLEADKAQRLWGVGYEDARDALARFAAAGGAGRAAGRPDGLDAAGLAAALRLPAAAAAPRLGALLGTFSQGELSGFATFREFVAGCAPLARAAPRRPARPPGAAAALGGAGFVDRAAAALRATWI